MSRDSSARWLAAVKLALILPALIVGLYLGDAIYDGLFR